MSECELSTLIADLEAAGDGSRELDIAIARYLNAGHNITWATADTKPFSTSIDAALPDECITSMGSWGECFTASAKGSDGQLYFGQGKTEALARRIAALKAREAGE